MGLVLIKLFRNGLTMIENVSAYMQVMRKQASWMTNWEAQVDRTTHTKTQLDTHVMLEEQQGGSWLKPSKNERQKEVVGTGV